MYWDNLYVNGGLGAIFLLGESGSLRVFTTKSEFGELYEEFACKLPEREF